MLNQLQRIGKSLMLPIAVLPAAALLLRLGVLFGSDLGWGQGTALGVRGAAPLGPIPAGTYIFKGASLTIADGTVTIGLSGAFGVNDLAGNAATTAGGADRSVTFDTIAPTLTLTQATTQADPTSTSSIESPVNSSPNT